MPRPLGGSVRPSAEELVRALNEAGSVKRAAEALGVARQTVHVWMDELAIEQGREWRVADEAEATSA